MDVICIMATCGRHYLAKRALSCFLNQDYESPSTLFIYNNSEVDCELKDIPKDKEVILMNNHISLETGVKYVNLGQIYRDILFYLPNKEAIINHFDDDDFYLPNHISEGVKGYLKAKEQGKVAYKPKYSYYRSITTIDKLENTLEPSIFVEVEHLKKYGYSDITSSQHLQWVNPLVHEKNILVDEKGIPTLIYDWSQVVPTFKTSGNADNPDNFTNYRNFSKQYGDQILKPLSKREMKLYEDYSM